MQKLNLFYSKTYTTIEEALSLVLAGGLVFILIMALTPPTSWLSILLLACITLILTPSLLIRMIAIQRSARRKKTFDEWLFVNINTQAQLKNLFMYALALLIFFLCKETRTTTITTIIIILGLSQLLLTLIAALRWVTFE